MGAGIQQHRLMVAQQVDHPGTTQRRRGKQPFQHRSAVRAAVHVIAQVHQGDLRHRPRPGIGGDAPVQRGQLAVAAMHVADRVNALAGRQAAGA
jgi:hypothetical protein